MLSAWCGRRHLKGNLSPIYIVTGIIILFDLVQGAGPAYISEKMQIFQSIAPAAGLTLGGYDIEC